MQDGPSRLDSDEACSCESPMEGGTNPSYQQPPSSTLTACFAMPDPLPRDTPSPDPRDKEFSSLLDKGRAEGEPTNFPPSCIRSNAPPRFQLALARQKKEQMGNIGWERKVPEVLRLLAHHPLHF